MKWYQMQWAQKYWGKEARERYRRYLQSDAWKAKRKSVLQAAGFRCRRCGAPATEVHHETYKRIYNERMSDLTALCSKCHEAAHSKKIRIPDQDPPPKNEQRKDYRKRKAKTAPLAGSGTIVGDVKVKGTRPLDNTEIRLVSACFDGTFATRNRALFMLGVSTGGRISELLGLQIGDVWQNDRAVH